MKKKGVEKKEDEGAKQLSSSRPAPDVQEASSRHRLKGNDKNRKRRGKRRRMTQDDDHRREVAFEVSKVAPADYILQRLRQRVASSTNVAVEIDGSE